MNSSQVGNVDIESDPAADEDQKEDDCGYSFYVKEYKVGIFGSDGGMRGR
jgi:hypothetical protein